MPSLSISVTLYKNTEVAFDGLKHCPLVPFGECMILGDSALNELLEGHKSSIIMAPLPTDAED